MILEINNTYELEYPKERMDKIDTIMRSIFKDHNQPVESITLTLLTDDALLEINESFLKHDYYTDILTFYYSEEGEPIEGELFLSIDRIKDNASTQRVTFDNEFSRVVFHGCLHLCGHDDHTPAEKLQMRSAEDKYLAQLSV